MRAIQPRLQISSGQVLLRYSAGSLPLPRVNSLRELTVPGSYRDDRLRFAASPAPLPSLAAASISLDGREANGHMYDRCRRGLLGNFGEFREASRAPFTVCPRRDRTFL